MTSELDQILIIKNPQELASYLGKLHGEISAAATFGLDDKRYEDVLMILVKVQKHKDEAVLEFTEKFDNVKLTADHIRITEEELEQAHKEIDKDLLKSIQQAIKNVKKYQEEIFIGKKPKNCSGQTGIKYTPIKRVGICVPGASAPLPSTVIMTAVPAQVAGVKEIAVVSPPRYNGSIHPAILATCRELEITDVYRIGGVQAVAALVFGTNTITNVQKIVGPGNQWVQTAKKIVSGLVGIDSIAGPSEVLIIANDKANPAWVAADMLSQVEHAPGSAFVFTDSQKLAKKILDELKIQVIQLSRSKETFKYLKQFSRIVVFGDMANVIEMANMFASEHLQIQCGDKSREIADQIENAGAIFIGDYSPVAVGDYWAGPSHTLPTGATARFSSALTSNDFVKSISIIEYDKEKLAQSADNIILLAEAEGLDAHARSVKIRQEKK